MASIIATINTVALLWIVDMIIDSIPSGQAGTIYDDQTSNNGNIISTNLTKAISLFNILLSSLYQQPLSQLGFL
jgi:hypothetical protein